MLQDLLDRKTEQIDEKIVLRIVQRLRCLHLEVQILIPTFFVRLKTFSLVVPYLLLDYGNLFFLGLSWHILFPEKNYPSYIENGV